jgi:restriction endonuclease S subunit
MKFENYLKLKEIAQIQTGYSFRSSIPECLDEGVYILQTKDFDDNAKICVDKMTKTELKELDGYLLKQGDLIFRSRGKAFMMSIFPAFESKTAFLAPLFKVSIKTDLILAEYLRWYINSAMCQATLVRLAEGATVKMISKSVLENLDIPVIDLQFQQLLMELDQLYVKEKEILEELGKKRKQFIESFLVQPMNINR